MGAAEKLAIIKTIIKILAAALCIMNSFVKQNMLQHELS
jgi:hypothetical protein